MRCQSTVFARGAALLLAMHRQQRLDKLQQIGRFMHLQHEVQRQKMVRIIHRCVRMRIQHQRDLFDGGIGIST